jgi:hypothetical protein
MHVGENSRAKQCKKFARLHTKQHPTTNTIKETVINLSDQKLEDAVYSLLQKGLNFAVTPRSTPIEDTLAGVEKAVISLPVEMAEEARQETVRIIKNAPPPKDNLTKTEKAALKTLKDNKNLTILLAKEMLQWYLNTSDYKQKISSLLEDPAYRKLAMDPTDAIERKTTLLLKKASLTEEARRRLSPAGSRPPRMYGLPKIHKDGVTLKPIVINIGAPT